MIQLDFPSSTVSGCTYDYTISGDADIASGTSTDGTFTFLPEDTGKFSINVNEYCYNTPIRSFSNTIWSKYVRREVSALSDNDREEFLDAFAKLWEIKTPEGKELYGDKYKSLYHFAVVHNDAGANPVCDEFHTGSGFINNHMYLGSYLEQIMRLINPKVSLHYMEYGIYFSSDDYKSHQLNQLDGGTWSEMFTEKYFGSNDPYTGKITNGRWADFTLPYLTKEFLISEDIDPDKTLFSHEQKKWLEASGAHMMNPYGLLRAPWNYSPATYTLRFHNVNRFNDYTNVNTIITNYYNGVNCRDYENFVSRECNGNPLVTLLTDVEDDVHGKVHFTVGGSGGDKCIEVDDYLMNTYGFEWKDMVAIAQSSQRYFKTYITMYPTWDEEKFGPYPLDCSANPWQDDKLTTTVGPGEDGGPTCDCNSYYFEDQDKLTAFIYTYFQDWAGRKVPQAETVDKLLNLSFEEQLDVMSKLCGRFQMEGDLAGSGAATDPIFWVVHGGVERIMQKIYIEGILTDYLYAEPLSECSGHIETGTKDWLEGYTFQDESIAVHKLTNVELAEYLNPLSDKYRDQVDFVYDHYDWSTICDGDATGWFASNPDVDPNAPIIVNPLAPPKPDDNDPPPNDSPSDNPPPPNRKLRSYEMNI
eukprot:gene20437-26519_t